MAEAEEPLTADKLLSMKKAKVFNNHKKRVNSMDFSRDGELVITSGDDELLNLFMAGEGKHKKSLPVKKYGCGLVRFTQHSSQVVCSSQNAFDYSLRYLSLQDNRYLRYFKGHSDNVISMAMSPKDDTFLSASNDQTVRLWDVRVMQAQGRMHLGARPCVSYDPDGLVFAVAYTGTKGQTVKLFDTRNYDAGPFETLDHSSSKENPNCLKFSNDGKYFLVSSVNVEPEIKLFDAFKGEQITSYSGHANDGTLDLEASFTPDAKYVLSGSEDGTIHMWETLTGRKVGTLEGHAIPVGVVQWNPVYMMLASACQNVVFWLPGQ